MKLKGFDGVKNIIFDLGNVIIDLDFEATDYDFKNLYGFNYDEVMEEVKKENGVYNKYEKGQISTQTFLNEMSSFDESISHDEVKNAWLAKLLDIPEENYQLLEDLKGNYRTFCLSNTNKLDIGFVYKLVKNDKGVENLDPYFEKVYLSNEMGMRKPDAEIFEKVLTDNGLNPEETLFIDDTEEHIMTANSLGIQTLHLTQDLNLLNFFTD